MCLLCSSILPCSFSPIDVDARALCRAAGSLKKLKLTVNQTFLSSDALAEVFDHRPLEELGLTLSSDPIDYSEVEVSSACSPPGM